MEVLETCADKDFTLNGSSRQAAYFARFRIYTKSNRISELAIGAWYRSISCLELLH